jgi:hypothetical protein
MILLKFSLLKKKIFFYNNTYILYNSFIILIKNYLNKKNIYYFINYFKLSKFSLFQNIILKHYIYFFEYFLKIKNKKNFFIFFNKFSLYFDDKNKILKNLKFLLKIYWILKMKILFKVEELFQLLFLFIKYKDISFFLSWLKMTLEKINFKFHKKIFLSIILFFNFFFKQIFYFFWFKGIVLKIKGKISQGGNSKKKRIYYQKGNYSWTNKSFKLYYDASIIRSYSGVLGLKCFLFF